MENRPLESKILADKIVNFKKKHNLTYQQLGRALDVDKSYLNRVVKTDSYMSMPVLIRLAKYMEIPLYAMFTPSEEVLRKEFIEKIKAKIDEQNLSMDDLEAKSGISPIRLLEIMGGESMITTKECEQFANILDIEESTYNDYNLGLLENLIQNLPMTNSKKESVIAYIKENLK